MNQTELQAAIERSNQQCPGGRGCTCCGSGCDCGCRNDCPRFHGVIRRQLGVSLLDLNPEVKR